MSDRERRRSFDEEDWNRPVMGSGARDTVLERRSLISNDDDVVDRIVYPILGTDAIFKGKFFTRGCRGMIEQIQIYRTATAGGTITLQFSPHPCLGPFYTVTIPIGPADAFTGVDFERMWDYDSLFIWVSALEEGEEWGYDVAEPHDGHQYTVPQDPDPILFCPWEDLDIRPFIRVVYSGETPGDVPVSGIINNIQIPNTSSRLTGSNIDIPEDVITLTNRIVGAGYVDLMIMSVIAIANSHATGFRVSCDGILAWDWAFVDMNGWGFNDDTQPMSLLTYVADGGCYMMITKKFEFQRVFELHAYNNFANVRVYTRLYPNLLR